MKGSDFFAQLSRKPPFSKMNPQVATFFKDYLRHEKVIRFGRQYVLNTHFPPFPSPAFNNMVTHFNTFGNVDRRRLFSATLAVTNRCTYRCWHCYNTGRNQQDLPLSAWKKIVSDLQSMGVVHVTLSGGEPLMRQDLESIAGAFDESTSLSLNTTGAGLSLDRAKSLAKAGIFALGVSLDALKKEDHDRMRGTPGAHDTALTALRIAEDAGLYPYVISLATRSFLEEKQFWAFMKVVSAVGVREVHLIEPCATGNLSGRHDVVLGPKEKKQMLAYQKTVAGDESLPVLSSFLYLESENAFGCGAGLTYLYIDGSGEVCPCNLVPLSFGNLKQDSLEAVLNRMGQYFKRPRCACVGKDLAGSIPAGSKPVAPDQSEAICEKQLPQSHPVPRFFKVQSSAAKPIGQGELQKAYDEIHTYYDDYWLTQAAGPVEDLLGRLPVENLKRIVECGCGTGYATRLLAERLSPDATLEAVDLSNQMIGLARKRLDMLADARVRFIHGDTMDLLESSTNVDLVISTWVLGYIPLAPYFTAACRSLKKGGKLAFVVHRDNSPREPLEIFQRLVAGDPSALLQGVDFDFPKNQDHIERLLKSAGFEIQHFKEAAIAFPCEKPQDIMDHLLKSGAGTAYFNAIAPERRDILKAKFITQLWEKHATGKGYDVVHEFIACVAQKRC